MSSVHYGPKVCMLITREDVSLRILKALRAHALLLSPNKRKHTEADNNGKPSTQRSSNCLQDAELLHVSYSQYGGLL